MEFLADALKPGPVEMKHDAKRGRIRIPLHPNGVLRLGTAMLHARSRADCVLRIQIHRGVYRGAAEFAVRQLYGDTEVGRVTWRFAARAKSAKRPARRTRKGRS